ncbi:MAG TPA: cytochrome c oxidase subunit II [Methylophilaceae bacterium]|nr:cytochrome c oxidase subunit II [Methylophilaceae bacterium]
MSYLHTYGPAGDPVTRLNWGLIAISCAVSIIIGLLVLLAVFRKRPPASPDAQGRMPLGRGGNGLPWIYIGVGISTVVLFAVGIWNAVTLAAVSEPDRKPAITVEITAHQWWWEARYRGDSPTQIFVTANEIHIPVGQPVLFKLASDDVIHSFWIPQLGGKTDVIPGQVNLAWLQADKPGTYRGQCGEYCGAQHAHMAMYVVAEEPEKFAQWRADQLANAAAPSETQAQLGHDAFIQNCSVCHTVRGTMAQGRLGPDLTHLMSRGTIAAGLLDNNEGSLNGWIANPQALKPGTHMPRILLQPEELHDVVAYLQTLK